MLFQKGANNQNKIVEKIPDEPLRKSLEYIYSKTIRLVLISVHRGNNVLLIENCPSLPF